MHIENVETLITELTERGLDDRITGLIPYRDDEDRADEPPRCLSCICPCLAARGHRTAFQVVIKTPEGSDTTPFCWACVGEAQSINDLAAMLTSAAHAYVGTFAHASRA